jgi:peptide/nickel transport system substrate-binding protein
VPKYPFDVTKAGALLDEAGYPKNAQGERLALRLVYDPANSAPTARPKVVAQQLKVVGLNVKLVPLERSLMLEKVFKQYDFDLYIHNYTSYGDPALGIGRIYTCDNIRPAPVRERGALLQPEGRRALRQGRRGGVAGRTREALS